MARSINIFAAKDALLSGLIEREVAPLLTIGRDVEQHSTFHAAIRSYIGASVRHQMKRPKLARLIDVAEKREVFKNQVSGTTSRLQVVIEEMLALPDAPKVMDRSVAAADLLALLRGLIDAAGEREEGESNELLRRTEGAALGYLHS